MASQANHKRRKIRPTDPDNLDFDLDNDDMPVGFLQRDVHVGCFSSRDHGNTDNARTFTHVVHRCHVQVGVSSLLPAVQRSRLRSVWDIIKTSPIGFCYDVQQITG